MKIMKRKKYVAPCITVYRCEPILPLAASPNGKEEDYWDPGNGTPLIPIKEEGEGDLDEEITG